MRTSGTSLFTAISKAQVPWQLFQVPEKFRNYIRPLGLDLLYIENWSVEAFLGHNFLHNLKEGYQDCFDSQNNSLRPFNVAKNHKNEVYYDVNLALFSVNGLYCDVNFPFSYYNPIKPTTEYTAVGPDCIKPKTSETNLRKSPALQK